MSSKYTGNFITKTPITVNTSAASGIWSLSEQAQYQKLSSWPISTSIPKAGLIGLYDSTSIETTQWTDLSGTGNHATISGTTPTTTTLTAGTFGASKAVTTTQWTRNSYATFPAGVLPPTYTLIYLARYNTSNATTAATLVTSNDFSANTTGFTYPFAGHTFAATGGQMVETYSAGTGDIIYHGWSGLITTTNTVINSEYNVEIKALADSAHSGSDYYPLGWDSFSLTINDTGSQTLIANEWTFHSGRFTTGATYSLGNQWARGRPPVAGTMKFDDARYYKVVNSGCNQIFTNVNGNRMWYSGFYNGYAGTAWHGNTALATANTHSNNWVLGVDQNNYFRTNKVDRYTGTPAGTTYSRLAINGHDAIGSNCHIAEIIIYDRTLSAAEITVVENYLSAKYGV